MPFFCFDYILIHHQVIGMKDLTTTDPRSSLNPSSDEYIGEQNRALRFAVAASMYILVAVAQVTHNQMTKFT